MLLTRTITKKILETIVHETFIQFGNLSSSSLLDSLKLLGFYYATAAGISINIEDLKTPDDKKNFLNEANQDINFVSQQWQQGLISDTERFQSIIDTWNVATESLKNRIIEYYQNFDPANNLYIMAFSGARGNMSQVRQLVGMRGLMSDQEGKIIDLPIQTNFREGLSSIDYIISSYGARKGIVDTALKTADSGYLTRRLIYIAQDLVIREFNCGTKEGLLFLLNKKSNIKNIVGRTLISIKSSKTFISDFKNQNEILSENLLNELKKSSPLIINVRSSLTCKSLNSICQKCYGWDLAQNNLISLGEAVGIIAGQSIGEPGTQLTMRTFHTGGIFTGETSKQILAPFSGKLIIPDSLKTISYRTNRGRMVLKLQQESNLTLINWKGDITTIFLDLGSYLYLSNTSFVKKGQIIAEYSPQSINTGRRRLKPIYTSLSGEIKYENIVVRKISYDTRSLKVNQDDGVIWITSGKVISLPKEIDYQFPNKLKKVKAFAKLKIISPFSGFIKISNNSILLITTQKTYSLELTGLTNKIKNCVLKISVLVKNYQYVDEHTILGFLEFYPEEEGLIYSVRKKDANNIQTLLFITESDIWKINSDQVNNFSFFKNKKAYIRAGNLLNSTTKFTRSGFFLKKDGFKLIFQNAMPIFLTQGTILNYKQGDFVLENKIFATLRISTQQTEDIVQGLPKIEELIEARKPKIKATLSTRPGVFLNSSLLKERKVENFHRIMNQKGIIKCFDYNGKFSSLNKKSKKKQEKQFIYIAQSLFLKKQLILYKQKIFQIHLIPSSFILKKRSEKEFYLINSEIDKKYNKKIKKENKNIEKNKDGEKLLFYGKENFSCWKKYNLFNNNKENSKKFFKFQNGKIKPWLLLRKKTDYSIFKNEKEDLLLKKIDGTFIFLEYLNPLSEYEINASSRVICNPGKYIDIGEPLTEGIIDAHELLKILFNYHSLFDGILKGIKRSLTKFQLIFVNSIQSIYQSQGVNISSKHVEIIVKQMTSKVLIKESGDTPFLPGELIRLSLITEICLALNPNEIKLKRIPNYEPILLSATNSSLNKDGFLSAAGFQETKRVLTKAAIEGSCDWLRGLKECIIVGRLIPAGSAFLNYKNYLDSIYLFKD